MVRGRVERSTVRSPAFVAVALTMSLLVIGLYAASHAISAASFREVEEQTTLEHGDRLAQAYAAQLSALDRISGDWAPWDDTYRFVQGDQPSYVEDNLGADTLVNLGITAMVFCDLEGRVVYSVGLDPVTAEFAGVPTELESLGADSRFLAWGDPEDVQGGLLTTEQGPVLFSARPITTSTWDWPPAGTLIVARALDDSLVTEIAEDTRLNVERVRIEELPAEIAASSVPAVWIEGPNEVNAAVVLDDWEGSPALALRATTDRAIVREGQRSVVLFGGLLGLLGLISSGVLIYVISREHRALQARVEAEREARRADERYRSLMDAMADAVFGVDDDGRVYFANPRAARLLGQATEELVGVHYRDLMTHESAERVAEGIERDGGGLGSWEVTLLDVTGHPVDVEMGVSWFQEGPEGHHRMQWVARDIAERKRFEHELVYLATHDHLTGLFNRRRFEEELEACVSHARRAGETAVLLWLDLDNFKEVNDSLGHNAGDDILMSVALQLSKAMRGDTVVARLGGDEFALLMPQVTHDEIEALCARVLAEVRAMQFMTDEGPVHLTASIGIVVLPDHATTAEEALARADLAMYRAKDGGRNSVCVYRPDEDWHEELKARFDWAVTIESALREDRFTVHWQPIIDLESGQADRYELLIRLLDERGSLVPPGSFLPVAEQLGLIGAIDRYMVSQAIRLLASMPDEERVRVDVNFSGKALSDTDLPEIIAAELMQSGVDPHWLGIEVTETAAVVDMLKARTFIEGLKSIGVRVSLDDFGSGFSSFYYLRNLPIDTLKIDGSFVRELVSNRRDQHVVRSIIELARGLGIETTAECVEDADTLDMLRSFGIRFAQGFHIGRPGPIDLAAMPTVVGLSALGPVTASPTVTGPVGADG